MKNGKGKRVMKTQKTFEAKDPGMPRHLIHSAFYILHSAFFVCLLLLVGCFKEPTPGYKVLPEGSQVYLSGKGLKDLSSESAALALGDKINYLNLDRNAFETLPSEVAALTGLKWLRLNENSLSSLPDLSALTQLRRIYLRGNRFASVPEALKALPALTDIELSENPIMEIPEWLAQKKGLENLSFNRTKLRNLPKDLSAWQSLHSLQLGGLSLPLDEMKRIRAALPNTAVVF